MSDLGDRDDAEKEAVFVDIIEPGHHTRIRERFCPFRYNVGIDQETHKSTLRNRSFRRRILRPEPRSGDAAKNSVRVPVRRVLRSHSSAATMTAAVRPCRVTVWGPLFAARSITSLNLALASATVQVSEVVILVILVRFYDADKRPRHTKYAGTPSRAKPRPTI